MSNLIRRASVIFLSLILLMMFFPYTLTSKADIDSNYLGNGPGRFNSLKAQDIDSDGNVEVVFGNYEGYLNIIESRDGSYFEKWRSDSLGTRLWGLCIADCDSDGTNEIIAGNGEGEFYVFDAVSNELEWKKEDLGRDAHGIAVGNIDSDENLEIVVGTGYKTDIPLGNVYVFDGKTHELEAELGPISSRHRGVAIDDVDLDGVNEIIFGSGVSLGETPGEGYIYIYGFDGEDYIQEWKSEDLDGDVIGLVIYDLEGDGTLEIIAGNGYRYNQGYCFIFRYVGEGSDSGSGTPAIYQQVWESEDIGPKAYGLDVGDIDDDGITEIVVGNQPGYIWIFDANTHEVEWKSPLLGTDILGIEIADVDLDGEVEIIASQGGYIGKADWTSAYTAPHIYIINGRTHEIETKLGEYDYLEILFTVVVIVLIVITLVHLNRVLRIKKTIRKTKVDTKRGIK
ncbi:MAG: hypothetical protein JSW00_09305 [Thermoplasmata archaeon]|nr:MAG: hypothetical protein JSW00_09305 [Thermoplasmata archaeon]